MSRTSVDWVQHHLNFIRLVSTSAHHPLGLNFQREANRQPIPTRLRPLVMSNGPTNSKKTARLRESSPQPLSLAWLSR
jgi:hypothetical protein